jgi:hypothetical protein
MVDDSCSCRQRTWREIDGEPSLEKHHRIIVRHIFMVTLEIVMNYMCVKLVMTMLERVGRACGRQHGSGYGCQFVLPQWFLIELTHTAHQGNTHTTHLYHPRPHVQHLGRLCVHSYSLPPLPAYDH